MATRVTFGDLARDPAVVARGLVPWTRGDPAEAVVETLAASRGELTRRRYTLWVWAGRTEAGEPAWALPVTAADVVSFAPRGPAALLLTCLQTAADLDGDASRMRIEDWRGHACLVAPGLAEDLAAELLDASHPPPGRARLATMPHDVPLGGPPIPLPATEAARVGALAGAAAELSVHPVTVALALLGRGIPLSAFADEPAPYLALLRSWGLGGEPVADPVEAPSLSIADDPCPLRRHARTVLQRLLRVGKVGPGYHTDIANFSRGAAAHERHQAGEVAEALLRAGLLGEKPSVGQRHIYLSVRALPDIHALIDRGETRDPQLAAFWTEPAPGAGPTGSPGP